MPSVDDYLALIPAYNAVQPNFMASLRAVVSPLVALQEFMASMPQAFDLDTAVGVQLDQVGLWIGRARDIETPITDLYFSWDTQGLGWEEGYWQGAFDPDNGISVLDDTTYRALLYAKAAANRWDGTVTSAASVLGVLLADHGATAVITDNQDMTMTVDVAGIVSDIVFRSILTNGYLPIKPEGVGITWNVRQPIPSTAGITFTGAGRFSANALLVSRPQTLLSGTGNLLPSPYAVERANVVINAAGAINGDALAPGHGSVGTSISGSATVISTAVAKILATSVVHGIGKFSSSSSTTASTRINGVGGFKSNTSVLIYVTPGVGSFVDGSGNTWSLNITNEVIENGLQAPDGGGTAQVAYNPSSGLIYAQDQVSGNWYQWTGTTWTPIDPGAQPP